MAITITKEPEGFYPAYNDSYVEFSSSLASDLYAEIQLYPTATFPNVLKIYPDSTGKYLINLKEAVKVVLNENGFEDANFFVDIYYKNISGILLNQRIDIKVFNASTSETTTEYYDFFKAVKQIAESLHSNPYQLLSYSADGVNHFMTYFEGFPFHFDILEVQSGVNIIVKSLNTGNESEPMLTTAEESFRVNVDKGGGNNWTFDNFLPLTENWNRLEIYEGTTFKTNLLLRKKKNCSGIYLKWFNRSGGFSHYLFDKYYIQETRNAEIGTILNNEFKNIENATGLNKVVGKEASASMIIKSKYEAEEYENIKDLFVSPFVQMYSSKEANVDGSFFDVSIQGVLSFSNKRGRNEASFIVNLPEHITAKL